MSEELEIVIKLLVSLICGCIIGYERDKKKKNAGMRTYMTVCMSTAIIMIVASRCFKDTNSGDVTRMAAAAIQGIGFLGAGLIINKGDKLEGITTAAMMWGTAVIGLAIGYGLYFVGVLAAILVVLISELMPKYVDDKANKKSQ